MTDNYLDKSLNTNLDTDLEAKPKTKTMGAININNSIDDAYQLACTNGFALLDCSIDDTRMKQTLLNAECGALVSFEGWVRNHNNERSVSHLTYYGYEALAINQGKLIIEEAKRRFDIEEVIAIHRIGELAIGDMAVWIGAVSAHRYPAFEACQWVLDTIKADIPVWKQEFYTDYEYESESDDDKNSNSKTHDVAKAKQSLWLSNNG